MCIPVLGMAGETAFILYKCGVPFCADFYSRWNGGAPGQGRAPLCQEGIQ